MDNNKDKENESVRVPYPVIGIGTVGAPVTGAPVTMNAQNNTLREMEKHEHAARDFVNQIAAFPPAEQVEILTFIKEDLIRRMQQETNQLAAKRDQIAEMLQRMQKV